MVFIRMEEGEVWYFTLLYQMSMRMYTFGTRSLQPLLFFLVLKTRHQSSHRDKYPIINTVRGRSHVLFLKSSHPCLGRVSVGGANVRRKERVWLDLCAFVLHFAKSQGAVFISYQNYVFLRQKGKTGKVGEKKKRHEN